MNSRDESKQGDNDMCRCCSVVLIVLFGVSLRVEADETETPSGPAAQRLQDRKLSIQLARFDKNSARREVIGSLPRISSFLDNPSDRLSPGSM